MQCFTIQYHDKHGNHEATKWADSPQEALAALKRSHKKRKWNIVYGIPQLVVPQPFSDESRTRYRRDEVPQSPPEIELHEPDAPPEDTFERGDIEAGEA